MYSLNAAVPTAVSRLARGLAAELFDATPRDRHTLVVKRLGDGDADSFAREIRSRLVGTRPFPARVTGVDVFYDPPTGPGPVAYLEVESPGIRRVHERLCERFDPVEGLEADEYVPHVTIARGGDADRLRDREVELEWTADSLFVWEASYDEPINRIALPA